MVFVFEAPMRRLAMALKEEVMLVGFVVEYALCMRCAKRVDVFSGEVCVPTETHLSQWNAVRWSKKTRPARGGGRFRRWTSPGGCFSVVAPWLNPILSTSPSRVLK